MSLVQHCALVGEMVSPVSGSTMAGVSEIVNDFLTYLMCKEQDDLKVISRLFASILNP